MVTRTIDGTLPVLSVPYYESYAPEDCRITNYELWSDLMGPSTAFEQDWTTDADEDGNNPVVKFRLREDLTVVKDIYPYMPRVTTESNNADGESVVDVIVFDVDTVYEYDVVCGAATFWTPDSDLFVK